MQVYMSVYCLFDHINHICYKKLCQSLPDLPVFSPTEQAVHIRSVCIKFKGFSTSTSNIIGQIIYS